MQSVSSPNFTHILNECMFCPDVLRPPIMDLYVSILLESEYNISFNPKFYYTSVTCELLTFSFSFLFLFLFPSIYPFTVENWWLGWLDFACGWSGHLEFDVVVDGNFVLEVRSLVDVVESRPLGLFWASLWRTWGFSFWFS